MTDVLREGVMDTGNDTQSESSTETNEAVKSTESSTADKGEDAKAEVPFNEHPRWKELLEKDKQRDAELAELRSFKEQAEPLISRFQPKEDVNIPSWFGGDEDSWEEFSGYLNSLKGEAKAEAIREIKAEQENQNLRVKEANDWFESNVAEIEAKGEKVDRNMLLKTAMDFELVDTQGRWNYKAAAEILKRGNTDATAANLEAKKKAASATVSENSAESSATTYKIPRFMRKGL